jgi:hypothetical protein
MFFINSYQYKLKILYNFKNGILFFETFDADWMWDVLRSTFKISWSLMQSGTEMTRDLHWCTLFPFPLLVVTGNNT